MKAYKKVTVQKDVLHMITCNRCAKVCNLEKETKEHLEANWGYFSGKDGEVHKWDICEVCYDEIVSEFKIKPKVDSIHLL